ncbi:hypothetical protein BDR26DRAFT_608068 [Obelidium mucronatum]|nr:hypothetical protein BDR26DRAFT_608068 [Obelidium mucronatum]
MTFDPSIVAVVGFPFLHKSLQQHADKFGVREHPNGPTLINVLKTTPPTQDKAVAVFSYLSSRQSEFSSTDWNILRTLKFIPITTPKDSPVNPGSPAWIEPTKVYFGGKNSSAYLDLFTHIDFGDTSNAFLRACGVKDEPTPQELAEQLVRNPQSFMNQLGFGKYLQVLRTIAANYYQLRNNRNLVAEMRNSAFLVGVKTESNDAGSQQQQDEDGFADENEKLHYQLASAKEIYIMDDTVLGQIFTPLGCPIETLLEEMYSDLGSQWLTTQVTEVTTPRGNTSSSERTQKLQVLINERALLLLYDGQQVRPSKDIVPGSEATLKSLEVLEVPEIIIERSFRGVVRTQKTTCCLMMDKRTRKYFLLITRNENEVDYFDVAQALGKVIFRKCRLNDALLLSSLLSTSLINLKRKGFPVDRILNLQEGKLKAAIAKKQQEDAKAAADAAAAAKAQAKAEEYQRQQSIQREQSRQPLEQQQQASKSLQSQQQQSDLSRQQPDSKSSSSSSLTMDQQAVTTATILAMFPDVDRAFLQSLVDSEKSNPKAIESISNKLLDTEYPKNPAVPAPQSPRRDSKALGNPPGSNPTTRTAEDALKSVRDSVKSGFLGSLWDRATGSSPKPESATAAADQQQRKSLLQDQSQGGTALPPPPPASSSSSSSGPSTIPGGMKPVEEITPQYTQNLKHQLSSSINTVKPAYDKSFRATIPNEPEPQANVPTRHASQVCKPLLDSDLIFIEKLVNEIPFYVDKNALQEAGEVSTKSRVALMRFVDVLRLLAAVFGLEAKTLNIYWDASGGTVAFNRGRTLFFNFRFYLGLHYKDGLRPGVAGEDVDTVYYWFMVACHELAHNFVAAHDAQHEFYFSSYAENYLSQLHRTLKTAGLDS